VNIAEIFSTLIKCPEIKTKTRIADICKVKPPALNCWTRVPAGHVRKLEKASGGVLTRYQMRPDVFGPGPNDDSDLKVA